MLKEIGYKKNMNMYENMNYYRELKHKYYFKYKNTLSENKKNGSVNHYFF